MLNWTPDTFWNSTPKDFHLAVDGIVRKHERDNAPEPGMSQRRFEELMQLYPDD